MFFRMSDLSPTYRHGISHLDGEPHVEDAVVDGDLVVPHLHKDLDEQKIVSFYGVTPAKGETCTDHE